MIRLQELTSNILICEAIKSLNIIFSHMTDTRTFRQLF